MNLEEYIKRHLDGTFTTFDEVGHVKVKAVPLTFKPRHAVGQRGPKRDCASRADVTNPFTPEEDAILIEMRQAGKTMREIGVYLKRGSYGLSIRWGELCEQHGFKRYTERLNIVEKMSPEMRARIMELRGMGLSFPQIAERTGLRPHIVKNFFGMLRRRQNAGEAA